MPDSVHDIAEARQGLRPSACPGLFRITATRDGGICRVKPGLGHLTADQARAVAEAAGRLGNGSVEATNRANLQLRGIAPDAEGDLIAALLAAGLGPAQPESDDIRNVMVSPTAGIDPRQDIDALPIARALLAHLETDAACRALPAKAAFLVDGGEAVAAVDHPHDVWLAAMGGGEMALGLAGVPPVEAADTAPFLVIETARAVEAVAAAITLFLDAAGADAGRLRFRDLVLRQPPGALLDRLAGRLGVRRHADGWRRRMPVPMGHLGIRAQRRAGLAAVGGLAPLGRLSPGMLMDVAAIAEAEGEGALRLTPWRSILVPGVATARAGRVQAALQAAGLIVEAGHPLASMVACAGSEGCRSGLADAKADARALAAALGEGIGGTLHVSGCAKSCAAPLPAEVTLIASGPGSYDLYRRQPAREGLGSCLGRSLGVQKAAALLRRGRPS